MCTHLSLVSASDINKCTLHNPCQNGATCYSTLTGYFCSCAPQFMGTNCDDGRSFHFVRVFLIGSLRVVCACMLYCCSSYLLTIIVATILCFFQNLLISSDETESNTLNISFVVIIADVNECTAYNNPCQGGGTCINTLGGYTCTCGSGYTGNNCETGKTFANTCIAKTALLLHYKRV